MIRDGQLRKSERWETVSVLPSISVEKTSKVVYSSVMSACGNAFHSEKALAVLDELLCQRIETTVVLFSSGLRACEKSSLWCEALFLLTSMGQQGWEANQICYTSAISACTASEWLRCLMLLSEVTLNADLITYSACISASEKGRQWQQSLGILEKVQLNRLETNIIPFNAVISSASWLMAVALLTIEGCDIISYNAAITSAGGEAQWVSAIDLLCRTVAGALEPDLVGQNSAISACTNAAQWQSALVMFEGNILKSQVNAVTFSATISALERASEWLQCLRFLREATVDRMHVVVNAVTYNAAIRSCGHVTLWQQALLLLDELENRRLEGRVIGYSSAISACGKAGRWEHALLTFERCHSINLEASIVTFVAAASACEKSGQWKEALKLLRRAERMGNSSVVLLNSAISACEKASEWQQALELLGEGRRKRVADIISYNATISACEYSAPWEVSLSLFNATRLKERNDQGLRRGLLISTWFI